MAGQKVLSPAFIATEAAQSGLKLAEDGKLPSLRLKEAGQAPVKEAGSSGVNPLLLFGALAFSLVATVVLVFLPTEAEVPGRAAEKQAARRALLMLQQARARKRDAVAEYAAPFGTEGTGMTVRVTSFAPIWTEGPSRPIECPEPTHRAPVRNFPTTTRPGITPWFK